MTSRRPGLFAIALTLGVFAIALTLGLMVLLAPPAAWAAPPPKKQPPNIGSGKDQNPATNQKPRDPVVDALFPPTEGERPPSKLEALLADSCSTPALLQDAFECLNCDGAP